jgi:SAM-dependent methyltransferase
MELLLPPWNPTLAPATGDGDLTWAYPWPAGERLAKDLLALHELVPRLRGGRLAELGCGRGRSGLTALLHGAGSVLFCDVAPEPLSYVAQALHLNRLQDRGSTCQHAWGEVLPHGPYEVILGADILYRPHFQRALLISIAGSLARGGWALLADPRTVLEPELAIYAAELGLSWTTMRRPGPYTLALVQVIEAPKATADGAEAPATFRQRRARKAEIGNVPF